MSRERGRPARRDARRNRERLLAAARAAFAEHGLGVSLDEIARRAGVGNATLYRHFPTREALIEAAFVDMVGTFQCIVEEALLQEDAWQGLVWCLERICELLAADRGLSDLLSMRFPEATTLTAATQRVYDTGDRLVRRAREQGVLRADFAPTDIVLIIWSISRLTAATKNVAPDLWRRQLGLILDGLRPEAAHPLPRPPLTREQLDLALFDLRDQTAPRTRGTS